MIPLVFVHGFMGGSPQWRGQVAGLPNQKVIVVDLPGFGLSDRPLVISRVGDFADWVLGELTQIGVDRFHLVGHSMGGMIAQEMAVRAAERVDHLVLYGTGATGVLPGRFETIQTSMQRAKLDGAAKTAQRISATWFLEQDAAKEYEHCSAIAQMSSMQSILAGLEAMENWDGVGNLPRITAKTMVLWGDRDRTYPWAQTMQLWQEIAGASLCVVPQTSHAVHLEKPEIFNQLISDFLP